MKLVHCNVEQQIVMKEYGIAQWIIENPSLFGGYVQELYMQSEGGDGRFVLTQGDKELNLAKKMELILNPLLVDINNRKILNKVYQQLSEQAYGEGKFLETQRIMNMIQEYFYQLEQDYDYMLEIQKEIVLAELFKNMGIQIIKTEEDYFSNVVQYIKIVAGLMEKAIVVLVNANAYFSGDQIKMLHETAVYEEVRILLVESEKRQLALKVPQYIIDIDMCEI